MANNSNIPKDAPGPTVQGILSANGSGTVKDAIDKIFSTSPMGPPSTAISDNFYGINHRQTPGPIQINKDYFGLTFFTRPLLNLSSVNIRNVRMLTPLLTNNGSSIPRIIRCLLDPRLGRSNGENVTSPLVDQQQAFIPMLTNFLQSVTGWQDVIGPTYTSQPGVYQEVFGFIDGVTQNYASYDITATFRNLPGDPITAMFSAWIHYASLVYQGVIVPYPEYIIENEIDYNTRIYRLVLDSTKTKVQKIGCCGAAFPISAPTSAAFNFEHTKPVNDANDAVSIQFRAFGMCYNDDILIDEFNRTVGFFNKGMDPIQFTPPSGSDPNGVWKNSAYTQIPISALSIFNNRGYARINPYNYHLEWWVDNSLYQYLLPTYNTAVQSGQIPQGNGSSIITPSGKNAYTGQKSNTHTAPTTTTATSE